MITRPTVLILGAGASKEFGFPVGRELLRLICAELNTDSDTGLKDRLREQGFSPPYMGKFGRALQLSGEPSVDAFLEHRREFVEIGKTSLAIKLIEREQEDALFANRLRPKDASWYEYLWTRMHGSFEDFSKNKLAVLTFNYDRSLEHFLFVALANAFGKSASECTEALRTLSIIHLYGLLGDYPYTDAAGRPYRPNLTPNNIQKCVKGIRIVSEEVDRDPVFENASALLQEAEIVCFLGFGFHRTNMERLRIGQSKRNPQLYSTGFGLTNEEREVIKITAKSIWGTPIMFYEGEVHEALRDIPLFR